MKVIISAVLLSFSFSALAATSFVCHNKSELQTPFEVKITKKGGLMTANGKRCPAKYVDYNPVSDKYKDWTRIAPTSKTGCRAFGAEIVGRNQFKEGLSIHWLSISEEMQNGEEGFAQLGFENDADPGAGATAKTNLRCFPK